MPQPRSSPPVTQAVQFSGADTDAWHRSAMGAPAPTSPAPDDATQWGTGRHYGAGPTPASAAHVMPDFWEPAPPVVPEEPRHRVDDWKRPLPKPHRHGADEVEVDSSRQEASVEPPLTPYLTYTAGWYGIPALFYLIWLITLDDDRQGLASRQLVTNLPWLFMAIVLSLAIAWLLRSTTVSWRTLTTGFAAAVIGAGVTTIIQSLMS